MKPLLRTCLISLSLFPLLALHAQSITTIAGTPTVGGFSGAGGPATSIVCGSTFNVVADNSGDIFFTDQWNRLIWKVNSAGIATVYAGTGVNGNAGDGGLATAAELYTPVWLSIDNGGNLYVTDMYGGVRKINAAGIISTVISNLQVFDAAGPGTGDGGPLSAATFVGIEAFVPDNVGNLYISDQGANVIRKVNSAGIISTIAGNGTLGYSGDGGPATAAQLDRPYGVAFYGGNMYIPDDANHCIRKVDASGIITTVAGTGNLGNSGNGGPATSAEFWSCWQVQFDASGNMFIADADNNTVRKVDNTGTITDYAGISGDVGAGFSGDGGPAVDAKMYYVGGIALDNAGNLYIVDEGNYIIRKVVNCLFAPLSQTPADNTICAGGNTAFTLTATGATGYQWQASTGAGFTDLSNDAVYGGTTTSSLSITAATVTMNTTQYRCNIVNSCGTFATVPATLAVNTPAAPTVAVATTTNAICAGSTTTFTASATNGGTAPVYQWQLNGTAVGTNTPSYTNSGLNNGDVLTCVLTSNSTCTTTPTVTSNAVTMTVNPAVTPTISVTGPGGVICNGSTATFTAVATNGGTSPVYEWQIDGADAGTNSATFIDPDPENADVITCVLVSNAACATTPSATNGVFLIVNQMVTPTLTIAGPNGGGICAGIPVTFTASATNSGPTPAYQWLVNGVSSGSNSPSYSTAGLNNGDVVSCVLTANGVCATTPTAVSNTVTMTISSPVTPAVTIAVATPMVCVGSAASFTASPVNGGSAPVYQWFVNGQTTPETGPSYVNGSLNNGDAISCIMTSDAGCLTTPSAASNTIVQQIQPMVNASLSIASSATTICSGTEVTFTATAVNGGSSPAYQWLVNGADVGAGKSVFTNNDLANGDVVSCIVTSSLSCSAPATSQNQVQLTVNPNPSVVLMPDTIIALGQSITLQATITGPVTSYEWTPATGLDNPNGAAPGAAPENITTYQLTVSTDANCTATGKVTIGVFKTLKMPGAFTPNGDGKNDLFRIPPSLAVKISGFAVFDRWGTRVFYTTNSAAGWDGTLHGQPQPTGTYVWMIEYEDLITGRPSQAQGTVILVR
jgi:gliding motility-associated-like protein